MKCVRTMEIGIILDLGTTGRNKELAEIHTRRVCFRTSIDAVGKIPEWLA
jgi:hypothetical protein